MIPARQSKPLRLHGTIARDLGVAIVTGRYQPGQILDGEIAASEGLSVSRTAYREAVRILAAKGLVRSRPKIGTQVSEQADWHLLDPDVLAWIFKSEPPQSLVISLFELRRIVEPEACALAASRRDDGHVAAMAAALDDMREHTLADERGREADQRFHAALLDASSNAFLASLTSGVSAAVEWTTIFKQRRSPLRRDPLPDHQRVFEAVEARDPDAARAAMIYLVDQALEDTTGADHATG